MNASILRHLQQNAKASYTTIAKELDVSEGTIRSRVNKMLHEGIFEFIIHTHPSKIGFDVQAIIGLSTRLGMQSIVAEQLEAHPSIRFVGAFSGNYDLMIQGYFSTNESLIHYINNDLAEIEGIVDVDVNVELKQYKDTFIYSI